MHATTSVRQHATSNSFSICIGVSPMSGVVESAPDWKAELGPQHMACGKRFRVKARTKILLCMQMRRYPVEPATLAAQGSGGASELEIGRDCKYRLVKELEGGGNVRAVRV